MPAVRAELGPTLPELLGPRWRALPGALRTVVFGLAFALVGAAGAAILFVPGKDLHVVVRGDKAFNFIYRLPLERASAERQGGAAVSDPSGRAGSFVVERLLLPPYRGDAAGTLPVYAHRLIRALAQRHDGFLLRQEGRANINRQQGYEIVFQYRDRGRLLYGRRVLLVRDPAGGREGADITLTAVRGEQVPNAFAVGRSGPLKVPLRSFRFGTERP